ncbi:MAG: hypothetical protein JW973_16705 [Bacteroidales bacterium]|nr:hypothetical protein [Bacteroidales bacterium]
MRISNKERRIKNYEDNMHFILSSAFGVRNSLFDVSILQSYFFLVYRMGTRKDAKAHRTSHAHPPSLVLGQPAASLDQGIHFSAYKKCGEKDDC